MTDVNINIPFDPIMTLVVFLIGVPALVFQFMPSDIRRIVLEPHRRRRLFIDLGVPILVVVSVVLYGVVNEFSRLNHDDLQHEIKWTTILLIVTIITAWVGIYIPFRYGRREKVIEALKLEAAKGISTHGRLRELAIEDLIDLGKNAESSQEQRLVLEVLYDLINEVCIHPLYKGDALETPILNLINIVTINADVISLESFYLAANILQTVVLTSGKPERTFDMQNAVRAASGLARAALAIFDENVEVDSVVMGYIQTLDLMAQGHSSLTTDVSQALFEVGSLAVKHRKDYICIAALDKMTTLLNSSANSKTELIADVVALLAYFWCQGGSLGKYAKQHLQQIENDLRKATGDPLGVAYEHCMMGSAFEAADKINTMALDIKGEA
ncbi:MAG: hypothetical protein AB1564_06950 [Chloroflexota bacterium]